jgi:type II secretory pathway pseudopilin PulG
MRVLANDKSGFTLLELILVLLLIFIILGLASLYFSTFLASARLQATARELSTTLKQARSLSRIHEGKQAVDFDLDGRTYGIEGRKPRHIPAGLDFKIREPGGLEIQSGRYRLVFEAEYGTEGPVFYLAGRRRALTVQLDPLLGSVVIK